MTKKTKLDRSIIDELIVDRVGRRAQFMRPWNDPQSPMSYITGVTIEQGTKDLSREVVIYWVDGGLPEYFSLPGLNPAPIVFSARYIEIGATLLGLFNSEVSDIIATDILPPATERHALQVVAELVLRGGDASTAAYLFARSLTIPAMSMWPSTIRRIEEELINETYMTIWFYALLHEIGHVYVEERGDERALSADELRERVRTILKQEDYSPATIDEIASHFNIRFGNPLHLDELEVEIAADKFAFDKLMRSSQHRPTSYGAALLALSVIDMFNVFIILNICAVGARHITDPTTNLYYEQWLIIGFHVRLNCLADYMATLLASLPSEDPAYSQPISFWENFLAEGSRRHKDRLDAIEHGLNRAMTHVYHAEDREVGLGELIRSIFSEENAANEPLSGVELTRFMDLADSLEISHPDLELLRKLLPAQQASVQTIQRAFYSLWIRDTAGLKHLYYLQGKRGYLVFIFCERTSLYDDFRSRVRKSIPPNNTLEEVIIQSAWEFDVTTICTRAIPPERRAAARILIEGSPLFDRLINETLNDFRRTSIPG